MLGEIIAIAIMVLALGIFAWRLLLAKQKKSSFSGCRSCNSCKTCGSCDSDTNKSY